MHTGERRHLQQMVLIKLAFLDRILLEQTLKPRINYQGLKELKSFCTANDTIIRGKGQPPECEKIFTAFTYDTGFVSRVHRNLKQLHTYQEANKQPNLKWGMDFPSRDFSKDKIRRVKKTLKSSQCSQVSGKCELKLL